MTDATLSRIPGRGVSIRGVHVDDADAVQAIYAPIVRESTISFELEVPTVADMRVRIASASGDLPWLVGVDDSGAVVGYVYASRHRERAAYRWSVDVTAYVRADHRGQGIGKALYGRLFDLLIAAGYCQAFAGIALPNPASVALHESIGFLPIGVYRNVGFKHGAWRDVGWWQKELQCPDQPREPGRAHPA
jgi:L-amino acid N-acyltransferase YncA